MTWKALQQFHQLYTTRQTTDSLRNYPFIERQIEMGRIEAQGKTLTATSHFDEMYEVKHLTLFQNITTLLTKHQLLDTNFKENDLTTLLHIEANKKEILDKEYTQKEISSRYFKDSKHLKTGSKLQQAVLKILETDQLSRTEHDQQFLYVLHCSSKNPQAIILCENENRLRKPRSQNTELWYAGGNNTAKLAYINPPKIPFYYLCDWDNKGIEIYQRIKKQYFPDLQLIVPQSPKYLPVKSAWQTDIDKTLFTKEALDLLTYLQTHQYWIEEESVEYN